MIQRHGLILIFSFLGLACQDNSTKQLHTALPSNADWQPYGKTPEFEVFFDTRSVTAAKDDPLHYMHVWLRQTFYRHQLDTVSQALFTTKYILLALDCDNRTFAGISVALFNHKGQKVARYDVPGYQWEFTDAEPTSYGGHFVNDICQRTAKKNPPPNNHDVSNTAH